MEQLHTLCEYDLVDLLSEYTAKYLRMISEGTPYKEVKEYRDILDEIVREINKRKKRENLSDILH